MNIKKYLIGVGLATAILTGAVSMVLAENESNSNSNNKRPPMMVEINPSGRALLRGTVKTVSSNSLTVTSWGGDWLVNTSNAKFLPSGDLSQISMGDFVGVNGSMDQNVTWGINAILVRDWTSKEQSQSVKKEIKELMKSISPKNWQGTASNVNTTNNSLTLTIEGTAYTVNLAAGAKIVNRNYVSITFAGIKNGDTVRVWGPATDTTITAYVVRDISVPAQ